MRVDGVEARDRVAVRAAHRPGHGACADTRASVRRDPRLERCDERPAGGHVDHVRPLVGAELVDHGAVGGRLLLGALRCAPALGVLERRDQERERDAYRHRQAQAPPRELADRHGRDLDAFRRRPDAEPGTDRFPALHQRYQRIACCW